MMNAVRAPLAPTHPRAEGGAACRGGRAANAGPCATAFKVNETDPGFSLLREARLVAAERQSVAAPRRLKARRIAVMYQQPQYGQQSMGMYHGEHGSPQMAAQMHYPTMAYSNQYDRQYGPSYGGKSRQNGKGPLRTGP